VTPCAAEQLDELRRLAARYGIAIELLDRLTLRPREVAHTTGASLRTVETWIADGILRAVRVRGVVFVPLQDLLAFLEEHREEARVSPPNSLRGRAAREIDRSSRGSLG
jgi:excisionase family DNA binding protein